MDFPPGHSEVIPMAELRLGDIIDDYCSKCRLLTNHSVVSIVEGVAAKVQCRTCYNEHKYRHAKASTRKKPNEKADLFAAVLARIPTASSSDSSKKDK
jgi:hypothetical protein